ncbi:MAG: wax ester/triacylglycerol synthase family O-acyltransferase [Proteobacteria bacterium]|nr:wax ester/triacylglycerol synthase family O-acyltransferase [Pseudomonadota bacterium]
MSKLRQLTKQDVLFVGGETATVYQHTAGLVILDSGGRPDFNFRMFHEHVIERVGQIPHFHWKLHEVPLGLDLPYWVDDDNFSYEHHIKRIAVPSPGDRVALGELVAHLYSKHLDRSRPLWEIWFIEGLPDGKFAILQKLHHCMMDGQGASKLGEILCDFEPDAPPHKIDDSITGAKAGDTPSPWQQSLNTTAHFASMAVGVRREILDFIGPKIRRQLTFKKEPAVEAPVVPKACFNADISSHRGFVFGSLPLSEIKAIKKFFEVSINDVVIAIVGSSMRAYLLAQDNLPEQSLRIGMPVSLRSEEDDEFSNKVTNTIVSLATDLADPKQRLQVIHEEAEQGKNKARGGARGLMEIMQMMPPLLVNAMLNISSAEQTARLLGMNFIVSSVRGSSASMYVAGVKMKGIYPMSIITPGMGINFTCVSYADNIDFGVAIEPELLHDAWSIVDGLEEALAEYMALVRKKPPGKRGNRAPKKTATKKKPSSRAKRRVKK